MTLEAGLLRRGTDISSRNGADDRQNISTTTTTYALRGLAGWSWLIADRMFISVAGGMSVGYEYGSETRFMDRDGPLGRTSDVSRASRSMEGYFRLGGAF